MSDWYTGKYELKTILGCSTHSCKMRKEGDHTILKSGEEMRIRIDQVEKFLQFVKDNKVTINFEESTYIDKLLLSIDDS